MKASFTTKGLGLRYLKPTISYSPMFIYTIILITGANDDSVTVHHGGERVALSAVLKW